MQDNLFILREETYSIIIGAGKEPLRPINHDAVPFDDLPVFRETGALIRTPEQGRAVARCLRGQKAMLRNVTALR